MTLLQVENNQNPNNKKWVLLILIATYLVIMVDIALLIYLTI